MTRVWQTVAIVLVTLGVFVGVFVGSWTPRLILTVCDVGQGDAIVVQYASFIILIDSGPNSDVLRCLQAKVPFYRRRIDLAILTHLDKDHVGGMLAVMDRYQVSRVWWNAQSPLDAKDTQLLAELAERSILETPQVGDQLELGGLLLRVVWDGLFGQHFGRDGQEVSGNAQSLGIQIMGKSFGFLSLGDLECEQELAVAGGGLLNTVSFLKVSHHGSKSSSCAHFLEKIETESVFISSGKNNSYAHPDEKVVQRFATRGNLIWRTDRLGTFSLFLDPQHVCVQLNRLPQHD